MANAKKRLSMVGKMDEIILVRMNPGDDLLECIWDTCKEHDIKTGVILDGSGCLESFRFQHFPENPKNSLFPEDILTMHGPLEASIHGTIGWLDVDNADPTSPVWPANLFPDIPGQYESEADRWAMCSSPSGTTGVPYVHAHCTCTDSLRTMCGHLMPGSKIASPYQEDDVPSHFTLIIGKITGVNLVNRYDKLGIYHDLIKVEE